MMKPGCLVLGLDLGQKRDPSALVMLEVGEDTTGRRDPVTWEWVRQRFVNLVYLERIALGTPYPDVVAHLERLFRDGRLHGCTLVVDETGVGAPVVDLLRKARLPCRLVPVTITGGSHDTTARGGSFHVPKRDLLSALQVLFDEGRLRIAGRLLLREAFVKELTGFKAGSRDDLALATALAWWWCRKTEAWRGVQRRVV